MIVSGDAASGTPDPARGRVRQVFRYLKAFAEQSTTHERVLTDALRSLRLASFPEHPAVHIGEVTIGTDSEDSPQSSSPALIRIQKPLCTKPPTPPLELEDWLVPGWESARGGVAFLVSRNERVGSETITIRFDADLTRIDVAEAWKKSWEEWAEAERPALAAEEVFGRFFELHGHIQRDGEQLELVLGDGRLFWNAPQGAMDFPVLLQRVELRFDPDVPEFLVEESDRAPELYGVLLQECEALRPEQLMKLREDAESTGVHPLERAATTGYLRRLAAQLGPDAEFAGEYESRAPMGDAPQIVRDPVLLLRRRQSGFSRAADEVLKDLEQDRPIPGCLRSLVGVETLPNLEEPSDTAPDEGPETSPWTEPLDTLFSKPANQEQIRIARALNQHAAVLVQGPPGTGKSHTIANLIGHLVAQGKRVLVTSHTAKALRVLRGHVVEQLRPLCLAVLENDLDGRKQLEEAVTAIVGRLTTSSADQLAFEDKRLTEERLTLSKRIQTITRDLRVVRQLEYEPIVVAGLQYEPSKAARRVTESVEGNDWIPGKVAPGAPLPLSSEEIASLYATNAELTLPEERELTGDLPSATKLPSLEEFRLWVEEAGAPGTSDAPHLWTGPLKENVIPTIEELDASARAMLEKLDRLESWQVELVKAGHEGEGSRALWRDLRGIVEDSLEVFRSTRAPKLEYDPQMDMSVPLDERKAMVAEILTHLSGGGSLGWLQLTLHRPWKRFLETSSVNGHRPNAHDHFESLAAVCKLEESRLSLSRRWDRQVQPIGLPAFSELGDEPEAVAFDYVKTFEELLTWWETQWAIVEDKMLRAGFRFSVLRQQEVASATPQAPFQRDLSTLREGVAKYATARLIAAKKLRAMRLLTELSRELSRYNGHVIFTILSAVRASSPDSYGEALTLFLALRKKRDVLDKRQALLERLEPAAGHWATAIRHRTGAHAESTPPGDPVGAWIWKQLAQELKRRAELDEQSLQRDLEWNRTELLRVTSALIETRTWLHQLRRTDLHARQALQGWADTQKRIGRGTGKRVPELRREARRLLDDARHAVPVWIMPLSRVAESFHPASDRFDVVIVDEASQSDVQGLLAWYLGDKVAVVGDHEQVSPSAVGQTVEAATKLIAEHLVGIPNDHLYDGKTSIYDLARQSFGGLIALREHFRCVPDIIEFSNQLCYHGAIRPLRDASAVPLPHVAEYVVGSQLGVPERVGKTNELEAKTIVALMKAVIERAKRPVSIGVVSLLGDEQAAAVMSIAARVIGPVELERHRFLAGNAAQFQGDERDVMFLSMVDTPQEGPLRISQVEGTKQRFNVAASRARDQMWVVHSLDPSRDLKEADLRRRLIEHVRDPGAFGRKVQTAQARAESEFERQVIEHLIRAGFQVRPQFWVGAYRLDMVVGPETNRVAVECDGDRYHPLDRIPEDMARQAVLERLGWRFVRVRGTRYFRDVEGTVNWLIGKLEQLGVPRSDSESPAPEPLSSSTAREAIVRRAWEIMREEGWIEEPEESTVSDLAE